MTYRELVADILGVKLSKHELEGRIGFRCQGEHAETQCPCNNCRAYHIWDKEVDLGKVYANLSTSDAGKALYKGLLNSMYGSVNTGRRNGRTHAMERSIELSGWQRFPRILDTLDFDTIRDIVDDALDNGFEFKLYNSTLYYREKDYANTDSAQDVD